MQLDTLVLDRRSAENLHRQIYAQLRGLIESRSLESGFALPSTRALSRDLGIGRNSVIAAYDQLALEGYLQIRKQAPPVVVDLPSRAPVSGGQPDGDGHRLSARGRLLQSQRYHQGRPGQITLHPGMPDPDNFPFNTWAKLLAHRAKHARHDLFGAYHIDGYPPLREAIARYLTVSRGVKCATDQIIITNGAQGAFDLLARLLLDPGDIVWMEEPGYYGASAAFLSAGAQLEPFHVGPDGWRLVSPARPPRLVYVTPSCHHPLGKTMPMEQRLNLIRMAESWNAWIIEDDYDSEYRFNGQPMPALQGIDVSGRVVYVGTFAKILFPAMRLGFMVVPPAVSAGIAAALSATGHFAPLLTQAALADFMNEGHFSRHLRRMRRLYAARRQMFLDHFETHLGKWMAPQRTDAGIQILGVFRQPCDDRRIAAAAVTHGLNVSPLSIQYLGRKPPQGLVLGFAASDERATRKAMVTLHDILATMLG